MNYENKIIEVKYAGKNLPSNIRDCSLEEAQQYLQQKPLLKDLSELVVRPSKGLKIITNTESEIIIPSDKEVLISGGRK